MLTCKRRTEQPRGKTMPDHFKVSNIQLADPVRAGFNPGENALAGGQSCVLIELTNLKPTAATVLQGIWERYPGTTRTVFKFDPSSGNATLGAIVEVGVPISAKTNMQGAFGPGMHKRIDEALTQRAS